MLIEDIIREGGWASTATQGTVIRPSTVKKVLPVVKSFINDFNKWAAKQNVPPMKMGEPLGSSAYYQQDDETAEYGDIDLQTIAPDMPGKTSSQVASYYNGLLADFVAKERPHQIHYEGKFTGNPIFKVGGDFVQVDFVWSTEEYADWARWRTTPERGLKGVIYGSMLSSFGEVMDISIQTAGAQVKIVAGKPASFSRTRKYDELVTITKDIRSFGIDILNWLYKRMGGVGKPAMSPMLKQNPGLKTDKISGEQLALVLKGVAESFEMNNMYGKFNLEQYANKDEFVNAFIEHFSDKMRKSATNSKYDKASTPEAQRKAKESQAKILKGIDYINRVMK
jgi:hypothetical protein